MGRLFELAEELVRIESDIIEDNVSLDFKRKYDSKAREIQSEYAAFQVKIKNYLAKTNTTLIKVITLYDELGLSLEYGQVYLNGNLPQRPINYTADDYEEKANLCVETINEAIKNAITDKFSFEDAKKICIAHFTLNHIIESLPDLARSTINMLEHEKNRELQRLHDQIDDRRDRVKTLKRLLEKEIEYYKGESVEQNYTNKILLGYKSVECSQEVKEYLKREYKFKDSDFNNVPILLSLDEEGQNVAFFCNSNTKAFDKYIKSVYLQNACNFNAELKLANISASNATPHAKELFDEVRAKMTDKKGKQISIENQLLKLGERNKVFGELLSIKNNNILNCEKVLDYNETHKLSLVDYTLVFVDNFPYCLDSNEKINDFIDLVNDSRDAGIFFIINGVYKEQAYKLGFEENENSMNYGKKFSYDNGNMLLIDFNDKDITYLNTSKEEIYQCKMNIFKYVRKLNTITLEESNPYTGDLLNPSKKYIPNDTSVGMYIPVGFDNKGEVFNFHTNTKSNPFAILTGNTGCGKTAFLHTLILNGALKYSPDELHFYIIDFKDKSGSADFDPYTYREGVRNLYIPHVKYLSTKSSEEAAFDVLNLINKCASENLVKIKNAGFKDLAGYNAHAISKNLPKLPQIYFIIDEYGTMIDGGSQNASSDPLYSSKIVTQLKDILRRIRTSGVGIIFSGQRANILDNDARGYVKNHIVFDLAIPDSLSYIPALNLSTNEVPMEEADNMYNYVSNKQGFSICRCEGNYSYVHSIYCGDVDEESMLSTAELIRKKCGNKYSTKLIVPGIDKFEDYDSFLKEPISQKSERNIVSINDDTNDIFIENEYDLGLKSSLYMGITNTTSEPIALKFYNNSKGYLGLGSTSKISKICNTAINSILYEINQEQGDISYIYVDIANQDNKKQKDLAVNNILNMIDDHPSIKNKLNVFTKPTDSLLELMRLSKILDERSQGSIRLADNSNLDEDIDFTTPHYIVINKFDWMLNDKNINALNKLLKVEPKEEVTEEEEENEDISIDLGDSDIMSMAADIFGGDMSFFSDAMNADIDTDNVKIRNVEIDYSNTSFDAMTVKNAIVELLLNGPTYNIFPIFTANDFKTLSDLCMTMGISNVNEYPNLIFGSYKLMTSHKVTEVGDSKSTICISEVDTCSVIRQYDAVETKATKYWNIIDGKKEK